MEDDHREAEELITDPWTEEDEGERCDDEPRERLKSRPLDLSGSLERPSEEVDNEGRDNHRGREEDRQVKGFARNADEELLSHKFHSSGADKRLPRSCMNISQNEPLRQERPSIDEDKEEELEGEADDRWRDRLEACREENVGDDKLKHEERDEDENSKDEGLLEFRERESGDHRDVMLWG